ncbi:MAG: hypothetical protein ABI693_19630 [Bryobacteraceae bacterium]
MLKTYSLPAAQEASNGELNRQTRNLGLWLALLLVAAIGGPVALYLTGGGSGQGDNQVASADGTLLGFAVVVSPNLALTDAAVPERVVINMSDHSKREAQRVRTERFEEGVNFSLLRADTPFSGAQLPALGNAEVGQSARAASGSGTWTGSLKEKTGSPYLELEPAMTLGPGLPVYQNQTLVGITAQTPAGTVLVPTRHLLTKFKELSAGQ